MKISKDKLAKLQGLSSYSGSSVTFTPKVYDNVLLDPEMKGLVPTFTCNMLTNGQVEAVKTLFLDTSKWSRGGDYVDKKERISSILKGSVIGWTKNFDLFTGEEVEFSIDGISNLSENVLDSIIMEMARYAGFAPR